MPRIAKLLMLPLGVTVPTIVILLTRWGSGSRIRTLPIVGLWPSCVTSVSRLLRGALVGRWRRKSLTLILIAVPFPDWIQMDEVGLLFIRMMVRFGATLRLVSSAVIRLVTCFCSVVVKFPLLTSLVATVPF